MADSINKLIEYISCPNIAEKLDDETLGNIAKDCIIGYELDDESRQDYVNQMKDAMAIAKQVEQEKSYPWPGASNVKYPLITTASIQFASRVYPDIVKGSRVVQVAVLGEDQTGEKALLADKISRQMSDQLLVQSDEWEPGTDKLLHMLPILGTVFRKTYWDPITDHSRSEVVTPDEIIINANVKNLESAPRITHIVYQSKNDIIGRINAGVYLDIEYDFDQRDGILPTRDIRDANTNQQNWDNRDKFAPHAILEQHCFIDLDEDGYDEPYIVFIHLASRKVLRIVARYDLDGIKYDEGDAYRKGTGKIVRIDPVHYFTDYIFIPNPDGSFYGIGFGQLLLPLNKTINTLINQLIDSGTLANMQGGFLGRGVRIKNGKIQFKPGEWIPLESSSGTSLKENIIPLPFKEPSAVLFQLLGLMMQTGKELSSVSDAMQGQEQAQNVPATTILALIEQGTKVFGAIQKRLYRGFKKEFEKIFRLNRMFMQQDSYGMDLQSIHKAELGAYENRQLDIRPVADPNVSSEAQRMMRIQALMQIVATLSPEGKEHAKKMYLQALQFNEVDLQGLLAQPDPNAPPPPEAQKIMAEIKDLDMKAHAELLRLQLEEGKQILQEKELEIKALQAMAQVKMAEAQSMTAIHNAETKRIELGVRSTLDTKQAELGLDDATRMALSANDFQKIAENFNVLRGQNGTEPTGQDQSGNVPTVAAGPGNQEVAPPIEANAGVSDAALEIPSSVDATNPGV